MNDATFFGGERLESYLRDMETKYSGSPELRVGFLAGATYPDGTPVAAVAAIQEWGARIEREPAETTIYRKVDASGSDFLRNGRFVKKARSNFASTHYVGAHVITIPPRPFFRNMIAANESSWPSDLAKLLKDYSGIVALRIMGERIAAQLQKSIVEFTDPPNAPSTVRDKGFQKPLIDSGDMMRAVDYEVSEG